MVSNKYFTGKNFILTLNASVIEFYQDIIEYLQGLAGFCYLLATEHFGQDNKHYHIYVQYENTKKLNQRRLYGAHVEKCYGSAQANIDYCKAEDKKHKELGIDAAIIDEIGEPRFKGGNYNVGAIKEMDTPDELPGVLYNTWKKIKRDSTVVKAREFRKNVKVYWIQGPSGVGKTNKAMDIATEFAGVPSRRRFFLPARPPVFPGFLSR